MRSLEEIIEQVNGNGRYQVFLILLTLVVAFPVSFMQTASVFITALPNSRCEITGIGNSNLTEAQIDALFIPWNPVNKAYDRCRQYNYGNLSQYCGNITQSCLEENNLIQNSTVSCQHGYHYDRSTFTNTVATEFNLVCDRLVLKSLSTAVFYGGVFAGSVFGGIFSDLYGRVFTIKVSTFLAFCCGLGVAFAPNYTTFTVLRFFLPVLFKPASLAAVVYVLEISRESSRVWVGLGYGYMYGIGVVIMSVLAFFWRGWRDLQIVFSVAFLLYFILAMIFVLKSPRWLASKGKTKEAFKTLKLMAKRNRAKVQLCDLGLEESALIGNANVKAKSNFFKDLLIRPYTRLITTTNMYVWMSTSLLYYGLSLNSGALAGNIYVNHALGGVMEFGAAILLIPSIRKFGCRVMLTSSLLLSCIALFISTGLIVLSGQNPVAEKMGVVLAMLGRFGSSAAFAVLYLQTVQMFPTAGRNTALGLASMAARVGSIVVPFTLQLQFTVPGATQAIFGVVSLIAACIAHCFPETKGRELLMTFDETEVFFKKNINYWFLLKRFLERRNDRKSIELTGEGSEITA